MPVDRRPPWEIAFERLAHLKQEPYMTEGKFKEYYIELTDISRSYASRMYHIDFIDMTTDETLQQLIELELPSGLYDNLQRFLRHADLVKFAKYVPEKVRCESDFQYVHDMIEIIRQDYVRKQALMASAGRQSGGPEPRELTKVS
jgi:hypothetical protein